MHVLTSSNTSPQIHESREAAWQAVEDMYAVPIIDTESTVQQLPEIGGTFIVQPLEDVYDRDSEDRAQQMGDWLVYLREDEFVVEPFDQAHMDMVNRKYITQDEAEEMFDAYLNAISDSIFLFDKVYLASEIAKQLTPHDYDALMDSWLDEQNTEVM